MSIVNQMIKVHHYPRYNDDFRGNPIIGNLVRSGILQCVGKLCTKCTWHYVEKDIYLPFALDIEGV